MIPLPAIHQSRIAFAAIVLVAVVCIAIGPAHAKPLKGLSYGSAKLDVYTTAASGKAPVIIYVHGGGWVSRSRAQIGHKARFFNKLGYVFASIDYTLVPAATVGDQARQVAKAVSWMRANAARFGGNASRIGLIGHSAGCHLSALAVLANYTNAVRALACIDTGAYDLAFLAKINGNRLPFLFARPFADRSKWRAWSPISYARSGGHPPILVAWSGKRNYRRIANRFIKSLAGTRVTTFAGPQYSHDGINNRIGVAGEAITKAVRTFFASRL